MKKKIVIILTALLALYTSAAAQSYSLGSAVGIRFEEYLSKVADDNLLYLAERYNVPIANAEIAMQKVFVDPTLSFEAADETYVLDLGMTFELGKRRSRVDLARTEAELEALAVEWFFQELRAEAADAFLDAILQRELLDVKLRSYDHMSQLSLYDSIRCAIGEISEIDARQTLIETAMLLNEVYQQEGEYRAAIVMLNMYMGNDTGQMFEPEGTWDGISNEYELDYLVMYGMERRADVIAASKSVDLALKNIRLVKAERRPDIELKVGYERDWKGFAPKRDMLTAGVTIPLKFSNINRGTIRQAEYMAMQNETQARHLELEIRTEISQSYFRYESLGMQAEQYRSGLLNEAQALLDGMTFRYRRGEIDILELLIAQRTYNEVWEEYLQTMKDYASSLVELNRNSGMWNINF